jgi:Na+:H+ antiporter, NhaA family
MLQDRNFDLSSTKVRRAFQDKEVSIVNSIRPVSAARSVLREFLRSEAAGGIMLMVVALLAMLVANSPWAEDYFHAIHAVIGPELTPKLGPMTVHLWINDGLMAIFFLLVGLEIKREFVDGHLSTWADRRLPVIAAAAGMVVPALVYLGATAGQGALVRGWAIPAATDIAFAIGVLALLGGRAPASLKLFLTTVAIVDDMGAVAIIALFYTAQLDIAALGIAALLWIGMLVINRRGVVMLWPYLVLAALLWYAVLLSGVHATIAGVVAAFAIPLRRTIAAPDAEDSTLHRLEHALAKPVAFLIVPLFGFANAGVSLAGVGLEELLAPLPLGIALGLFLGKQIGILGSVWMTVKFRLASRPKDASWTQVYGVALLCGIGFTMSLFIGGLAFADTALGDAVKIGVLMGSLASALCGYLVLRLANRRG